MGEKFCPSLWPEEPVPIDERDCKDCGLYAHGSPMVWGEGNPQAPLMIVLDNPGLRKKKSGETFVCGTRQTLQQTAFEVGLTMDHLYVTYILKRRPVKAYGKEKTRTICSKHLHAQIEEKQPSLIFCLGNVAVQAFLDDETLDVKSTRGKTYTVNDQKVRTAYHPLAIRRRPNLHKLFLEDWQQVADLYKLQQAGGR